MLKHFFYILLLSFIMIGCKAKKLRNQAVEFEKLGEFEQAAQYYYKSLKRNNKDVGAIVGYKKNSQIVLDQTLENFINAFENDNFKTAVYLYKDANKLKAQAKTLNITLRELSDYSVYYNEALDSYLSTLYKKGTIALETEDFTIAKANFKEIVSLNSKFKDSASKLITATYEPMYVQGVKYLENSAYRKAYYEFDAILKNHDYKDALALKLEAQEKGTIKIAIISSYGSGLNNSEKRKFSSLVQSRLNDIPSPFYKIIDLTNTKRYRSFDQQLAYAKSRGAKALFTMRINDLKTSRGLKSGKTLTAYTKKKVEYKDAEGITKTKTEYNKTSCMLYKNSKKVRIEMEYKVVSTLDQSILISDFLSKEVTDRIEYATYNGDQKQLVAGYWKYRNKPDDSDKVKDTNYNNKKLQQLLENRKTLKQDDELFNELLDKVSSTIQYAIADYDPS